GDLAGARDRLQHALEVKERALPPDHPDLAVGLNGLAYILVRQGAYDDARPYLERALAINAKAYGGEDHWRVAETLQTLGELWWRSGHPAKALPYLQRSIRIREKTSTPGSPDLAIYEMTLGAALRDLRRYQESEPHLRRALELARSSAGKTPITAADAASEY